MMAVIRRSTSATREALAPRRHRQCYRPQGASTLEAIRIKDLFQGPQDSTAQGDGGDLAP